MVQKQSLDAGSFLEFLSISNKLGKSFDLLDFMSSYETQILLSDKSKEDLKKILEFIPKSNMELQDISYISSFLTNNIGKIVVPQGKKENALVKPTELCGMLADCGVFEYCFRYYLMHCEIENLENDDTLKSWASEILSAVGNTCAVDNLDENQTKQIKKQILGELSKAAQARDVIKFVKDNKDNDDKERLEKLGRIQKLSEQELLKLGLEHEQKKEKEDKDKDKDNTGNNEKDKNGTKNDNLMKQTQKIINDKDTSSKEEEKKKRDKFSKNNKKEEKEENKEDKKEENEIKEGINKYKYNNNNLLQKSLNVNLNKYQNSDNNGTKTGEEAGIYATLAAISIFVPPVFGIGLFILKFKDPEYKIAGKDIILLFIYSLPIVAPITGFIMDYKASQKSQEMEVKSLANGGNKNDDKETINDKINNINQNQLGDIKTNEKNKTKTHNEKV